jgi:hypothetical protein
MQPTTPPFRSGWDLDVEQDGELEFVVVIDFEIN